MSSTTPPPSSTSSVGNALDEAPLSMFHLRALVAASGGFLTDAYDLFIIGAAIVLIKAQWHLSATQVGMLGSATLVATLIGATVFGRIADVLGRKAVYGIVTVIMAGGAIASALAPSFVWLLVFRFVLGLGIGGDYPISGVLMSEYSNRANRGRLVGMVFSMQAVGLVIGPIVALTLLGAGVDHSIAWRIMLGLGAVPAVAVLYLRTTLPESPRFVAEVQRDETRAGDSLAILTAGALPIEALPCADGRRSLRSLMTSWPFLRLVIGTAGAWFLLDYAYYGNTISTPLVLRDVAPGSSLIQSSAWSLIVFVVFAVPGYALGCLLIDRIGHRRLQWMGFVAMAAAFGAISLIPGVLTTVAPFLLLFGMSYFFTEFGPNMTTFVIPTEVFPTEARTTGHGIAAGVGKLGAFLGVFLFPLITAEFGLRGTLLISTAAALGGAALTFMLPEASGRSLSEMAATPQPQAQLRQVPVAPRRRHRAA